MKITLKNYKEILGEDIQLYDWSGILDRQELSEEFIREFKDKVYWSYISRYQKLSESFIREFKDKVDWDCISWSQKLSESFIREFQDELDLDKLVINSVFYCGKSNRVIYIQKSNPEIINIGCFEGTKEEAIKAVSKKYSGKEEDEYIAKIEECFDYKINDSLEAGDWVRDNRKGILNPVV